MQIVAIQRLLQGLLEDGVFNSITMSRLALSYLDDKGNRFALNFELNT
jgi:hypothetical protein